MTVTLTPRLLVLLIAGAVAAAVLVACGGDDESKPEVVRVRQAVNEFTKASDAKACDLLTSDAIDRIYGSRSSCVEESKGFKPGSVRIERVDVESSRAKVKAASLGGDEEYTVDLRKEPPKECESAVEGGVWLINQVNER